MAHPEAIARRCDDAARRAPPVPVLAMIDTPGAWPGGRRRAARSGRTLARSHALMARLTFRSSRASSGGRFRRRERDRAGRRVLMQEHAIYTVITPEGCRRFCGAMAARPRRRLAAFKPDAAHCHRARGDRRDRAGAARGAQNDYDEAAQLLAGEHRGGAVEIEDEPGSRLRRQRRASSAPWASRRKSTDSTGFSRCFRLLRTA